MYDFFFNLVCVVLKKESIYSIFKMNTVPVSVFIIVVVIYPIIEEYVFRKTLFNLIASHSDFQMGLFLQAIVFACMHEGIIKCIFLFFFAIYLSKIYLKHKSLIFPILVHCGYNLAAILFN